MLPARFLRHLRYCVPRQRDSFDEVYLWLQDTSRRRCSMMLLSCRCRNQLMPINHRAQPLTQSRADLAPQPQGLGVVLRS